PITDVAHFGDFADVMGYDLSDIRAVPGQTIDLTLLWRVNRAIDVDNAIFIHLLDAQNNVIANYDVIPGLGAYPTWLWKPNEVLATHHLLHIPNRAKPGRYTLEIGLYNVLDGERMDRVNDKGESVDSRLVVGQVKIAPAIARVYAPTHSQWANFDNQIELLGYDLQTDDAPRSYRLALYWKALSSIPRDYTIFVHVLDSQGNIVAQFDHQPQNGNYPTLIWDANEQVKDDLVLTVAENVPPGNYQIKVGWYDLATGARLRIQDASGQTNDFVILNTPITVK